MKCDPKCAALCDFVRADLHSQSENDIFASERKDPKSAGLQIEQVIAAVKL